MVFGNSLTTFVFLGVSFSFVLSSFALSGIPTAPGIVIPATSTAGLPNASESLSSDFSSATSTPVESQSLFTTEGGNVTLPTPRLPPPANSTVTAATTSGGLASITSAAGNLTATTTLGYLGNATSAVGSVVGAGISGASSVAAGVVGSGANRLGVLGAGVGVGLGAMMLLGGMSVVVG